MTANKIRIARVPVYIKLQHQKRHTNLHVESFYGPRVEIAFKGVPRKKKNKLVTEAKQIERMQMSRGNLPRNTRHNTDLLWLGHVCFEPVLC